ISRSRAASPDPGRSSWRRSSFSPRWFRARPSSRSRRRPCSTRKSAARTSTPPSTRISTPSSRTRRPPIGPRLPTSTPPDVDLSRDHEPRHPTPADLRGGVQVSRLGGFAHAQAHDPVAVHALHASRPREHRRHRLPGSRRLRRGHGGRLSGRDCRPLRRRMSIYLAITSRVTRPRPIFVEAFKFLASVVSRTPKLTIPSPSMLYTQVGRANIDATVYPDLDAFVEDTAAAYRAEIADLYAAGCRY